MEFMVGTSSLQALVIGFGLETDFQPQWERVAVDGDHQDRLKPDTPWTEPPD